MTWPSVSLAKVSQIVSGATPRTSEKRFWDGDVLWTTPKDISELETPYLDRPPRTITREGLQSCATSVLPPNSVLLSSRAPIGLVAINRLPVATNQGFKSLVPDRDLLDSEFLYYWLRSKTDYLQNLGNGATFKEISKAVVERIKIPLPPLAEQRRIASILAKADALSRERKRALQLLESLTQSIFLEMFGDPLGRDSAWERSTVGHAIERGYISEIQDGNHGEKHPKVADFVADGVPFITANCLQSGELIVEDAYRLDRSWLSRLRVGFAKPGDFLLSHKGTIGEVAIAPPNIPNLILSPQVTYYRLSDRIEARFLAGMFRCPSYQAYMASASEQSTRAYIGIGRQKDLPLLLPPVSLQQRFSEAVDVAGKQIERFRVQLKRIKSLIASLQHRAFSGQL